MSLDLEKLTIKSAHQGLIKKKFSSKELTQAYLDRIEKIDKDLFSFLKVTPEVALEQAEEGDQDIVKGHNLNPLIGIPAGIKDNIVTRGTETTAGSKILGTYSPPFNATAIKKLKTVGLVQLGKTNLDELAMGSSTENSAFSTTKNPWDLSRVPGGSSGGSAAAVAASLASYALGSDTAGSVRQPAALCGVVGLKPTYGRVSRYGLIAMASSLDCIGPITRTVEDAALVLNQIAGLDSLDSTTKDEAVSDFTKVLKKSIKGMKLGVPKEYFVSGMDPEVEKRVKQAIKILESLGAQVKDVSLPHTEYALAVYHILMPAEVSANLSRYDGIRYGLSKFEEVQNLEEVYSNSRAAGFGEEVRRRIVLGVFTLSRGYYDQYYLKALKVRTKIIEDFEKVFKKIDALITPTSPTVAFKLGEKFDDPLTMYLSDIYTVPINIAGLPAISLPCGLAHKLPVGLQIIGKQFDEETVLKVASAFEKETNWSSLRPEF